MAKVLVGEIGDHRVNNPSQVVIISLEEVAQALKCLEEDSHTSQCGKCNDFKGFVSEVVYAYTKGGKTTHTDALVQTADGDARRDIGVGVYLPKGGCLVYADTITDVEGVSRSGEIHITCHKR